MFADDTNLYQELPSFDLMHFKETICKIEHWMNGNKLKCNIDKSKALVFASKVPTNLSFGELSIKILTSLKYLGIILDNHLSFSEHVAKIKSKLLFFNYVVRRSRDVLTRSQMILFYKLHINPLVQYGVLIYGCTSYSQQSPILKIQKRFIRTMFFLPKYASVMEIMLRNELPTVYELHVYELSKYTLNCLRGERSHRSLNNLLRLLSLRSVKRQDAIVPFGNMKKLEQSLSKRIPLFYNRLNAAAVLPSLETIMDMSEVQVSNFKQEFCRTFILGNSDFVQSVFGLSKIK